MNHAFYIVRDKYEYSCYSKILCFIFMAEYNKPGQFLKGYDCWQMHVWRVSNPYDRIYVFIKRFIKKNSSSYPTYKNWQNVCGYKQLLFILNLDKRGKHRCTDLYPQNIKLMDHWFLQYGIHL